MNGIKSAFTDLWDQDLWNRSDIRTFQRAAVIMTLAMINVFSIMILTWAAWLILV